MPTSQIHKSFLNMAGEFLVAGELNRRDVLASVTYGASKSADIFAKSSKTNSYVRIEVKTTDKLKWLTGQKAYVPTPNVFWVFVYLPLAVNRMPVDDDERGAHAPRYFVLSSAVLSKTLKKGHDEHSRNYEDKHGQPYPKEKGVPQIGIRDLIPFESQWFTITSKL